MLEKLETGVPISYFDFNSPTILASFYKTTLLLKSSAFLQHTTQGNQEILPFQIYTKIENSETILSINGYRSTHTINCNRHCH